MKLKENNFCRHFWGLQNYYYTLHQWRAVTSETGHATGIRKTGHAIGYFMDS